MSPLPSPTSPCEGYRGVRGHREDAEELHRRQAAQGFQDHPVAHQLGTGGGRSLCALMPSPFLSPNELCRLCCFFCLALSLSREIFVASSCDIVVSLPKGPREFPWLERKRKKNGILGSCFWNWKIILTSARFDKTNHQ